MHLHGISEQKGENTNEQALKMIREEKEKKKLKGKGYSITESLTAMKMKKLTEACNSFGFTNMWTQDGKILCKEDNRIKGFFY